MPFSVGSRVVFILLPNTNGELARVSENIREILVAITCRVAYSKVQKTTGQPIGRLSFVFFCTSCWCSTSLNKHNRDEQCIETAILYYLLLLMRQIKLITLKCLSLYVKLGQKDSEKVITSKIAVNSCILMCLLLGIKGEMNVQIIEAVKKFLVNIWQKRKSGIPGNEVMVVNDHQYTRRAE